LGLFPDFALLDSKLIIEVDDPGHRRRKKQDAERTAKLEKQGWRVLRCTNADAMTDPWGTVDKLMEAAGLPHRTKRP
jgi:very-short-patch-repair endonuclease